MLQYIPPKLVLYIYFKRLKQISPQTNTKNLHLKRLLLNSNIKLLFIKKHFQFFKDSWTRIRLKQNLGLHSRKFSNNQCRIRLKKRFKTQIQKLIIQIILQNILFWNRPSLFNVFFHYRPVFKISSTINSLYKLFFQLKITPRRPMWTNSSISQNRLHMRKFNKPQISRWILFMQIQSSNLKSSSLRIRIHWLSLLHHPSIQSEKKERINTYQVKKTEKKK